MAGWCSDSESEDEPLNYNIFARKSFGFIGLDSDKETKLRNIVTVSTKSFKRPVNSLILFALVCLQFCGYQFGKNFECISNLLLIILDYTFI